MLGRGDVYLREGKVILQIAVHGAVRQWHTLSTDRSESVEAHSPVNINSATFSVKGLVFLRRR